MKLIAIGLMAAALGAADTYPRQAGIDAIHYIFRLALSDSTDEILGEATADLRFDPTRA